MKILITSATSAPAYRLKNQLVDADVLMGDFRSLPTTMLAAGSALVLPNPASPSYTHEMLTFCLDKGIAVIYALDQEEYNLLTQAQQLFAEYGIQIFAK